MKPFILGIAGGSGAGKTTIVNQLVGRIGHEQIAWLPYDAYYHDLGHLTLAERQQYNFDHPDAFDTELYMTHIMALQQGQTITIPNYDFVSYTRVTGGIETAPRPILVLDGILLFVPESLRSIIELRVFIDTADDIRLLRRMQRDTTERGRSFDSVQQQYLDTVRPMHHAYVAPSRQYAHVIVPGDNEIDVATTLLQHHIQQLLMHT
ncbi:MAG: uridine kinase [Roseiflexaceae bacterium]|jgi:uridine kinase